MIADRGLKFFPEDNVACGGKLIEICRGFDFASDAFGGRPVGQVAECLLGYSEKKGEVVSSFEGPGIFYFPIPKSILVRREGLSEGTLAGREKLLLNPGERCEMEVLEKGASVFVLTPHEYALFEESDADRSWKVILDNEGIRSGLGVKGLKQVTRHFFPKGKTGGNHWHRGKGEFIYVASGKIELYNEGGRSTVKSGERGFLPRGEGHALHNAQDAEADVYEFTNLRFDPENPRKDVYMLRRCLVSGRDLGG